MFHDILVAVDGSNHAERALAESVDIAQTQSARLTILTSIPHPALTTVIAGTVAAPLADQLESEFAEILRRAAAAVPADVEVATILTATPASEALSEQVASGHFDLLVMGSRGRGAIRAMVLGSVSHHLVNVSPIPVLVIHGEGPIAAEPTSSGRTASAT